MATRKKAAPSAAGEKTTAKPSSTAAWFQTGLDGAEAQLAQQKANKEAYSNRVNRFTLKPGTKKRFLFLDDKGITLNEHDSPFDPSAQRKTSEHRTCLFGMYKEGCPACAANNRKHPRGFLSVIDLETYDAAKKTWLKTQWSYKKGEKAGQVTMNERKLFAMSMQTAVDLGFFKSDWGGVFTGCVIETQRPDDNKSSSVGTAFRKIDKINLKLKTDLKKYGLEQADLAPFDYLKELAPVTLDQMKEWLMSLGQAPGGDAETVSYE